MKEMDGSRWERTSEGFNRTVAPQAALKQVAKYSDVQFVPDISQSHYFFTDTLNIMV
jgi:hypothetical protein